PVFGGSPGEEQLRDVAILLRASERASFFARDGVVFGRRREREELGGREIVFMLAPVPRRLSKPVIEIALPAATDVGDRAVAYGAVPLVGIKAFEPEVMNEPPRLRDSKVVRPLNVTFQWIDGAVCSFRRIAEVAHNVADRGQSQPGHSRTGRCVDEVIQ